VIEYDNDIQPLDQAPAETFGPKSDELYEVHSLEPGFDTPTGSRVSSKPSGTSSKTTKPKKTTLDVGDDEKPVVTRQMKSKGPKKRQWYIVHTYSGHENKVKTNLERRIASMNMQDKIFRVEVPQKMVTRIKEGKRVDKEERIFPGYVLVEMMMDDDSWYVVRYTPGVTRFIGNEKDPIPARESEIRKILLNSDTKQDQPKVEIDVKAGDMIQIITGPFADFDGTVTEVQPEKERLKAMVSIFGRETPVELHFSQIQKYT